MSSARQDPPGAEAGSDAEARLVSFVIRFVFEGLPPGVGWHGVIRHVQSDAERYFTQWEEAVAFIGEFVDVDTGG
jgi:hypothetical protein